ncbi:polysaccharide biosynthesis/export family protein [Hydrocarboniphaga effusa]|uniref:polysaccharide biosynthesis/export family protein n=1 Tax=Hydrocarboniphaga effusa TaxID=243629 RepID=UPI00398BCAE4
MRVNGNAPTCLLTAAMLLSLTACVPGLRVSAGSSQPTAPIPYHVFNVTPSLVANQQPAAIAPSEDLVPLDLHHPTEYVVGPGDVLQVIVWEHMELTNPFGSVNRDPVTGGQLVAADGTVTFPYVGNFKAAGLTVQQIQELLVRGLSAVVTKPQVNVRIAAFRSRRIQVTGEVKNPGVITLDDTPKGAIEAINERGGLNTTASRRTAVLIRDGKSYPIDLAGLLSGGTPSINPQLNAGDTVHVPDTNNDQVFVLGELNKQGPLIMGQQRMSLMEALTKSGGMDNFRAEDSGVLVFRRPPTPQETSLIYALDMSTPQGMLLAGEFNLQPRDVVYVKATAFAQYNAVINQILPTISTIFQIDRLTR